RQICPSVSPLKCPTYPRLGARCPKTTAPTLVVGTGWAQGDGGGMPARPRTTPVSVHLDGDALRLRLGPLGDEDPQNAVLVLGGGLVGLESGGGGGGGGGRARRARGRRGRPAPPPPPPPSRR